MTRKRSGSMSGRAPGSPTIMGPIEGVAPRSPQLVGGFAQCQLTDAESAAFAREIGCLVCGAGRWVSALVVCERCRRELAPTPVQELCEALGWTLDDFAEGTGISRRSAARAMVGCGLAFRTAVKIAEVTGLDIGGLVAGVEAPEEMRA